MKMGAVVKGRQQQWGQQRGIGGALVVAVSVREMAVATWETQEAAVRR